MSAIHIGWAPRPLPLQQKTVDIRDGVSQRQSGGPCGRRISHVHPDCGLGPEREANTVAARTDWNTGLNSMGIRPAKAAAGARCATAGGGLP
jgi:hypothetical protein